VGNRYEGHRPPVEINREGSLMPDTLPPGTQVLEPPPVAPLDHELPDVVPPPKKEKAK